MNDNHARHFARPLYWTALLLATLALLTACVRPMSNEQVDAAYIACVTGGGEAQIRRNITGRVYAVECVERREP